MKDMFPYAVWELKRRKSRTISNLAGYTISLAIMIVLVIGLLESRDTANRVLQSTGTHFIAYLPYCIPSCQPFNGRHLLENNEGFVANGIAVNLIPKSFITEAQKISYVKDVSPFLLFQFSDSSKQPFTIGGFDPTNTIAVSSTSCASRDIISGRFLAPGDTGMVILEEAFALLKKLKVSDHININGNQFNIVGIINTGIRPAKANIYMIYNEAERLINIKLKPADIRKHTNLLLIETQNALVHDSAMIHIKKLFPSIAFSSYNCYKPASKVIGLNEKAVWILTLIIGFSTLLLSVKSQYSSIIERRREIGILKSIGWSNKNVISQILIESTLQSLSGGFLGCLLAIIFMLYFPTSFSEVSKDSLNISIWILTCLAGIMLSFIGGIIAGSFPALWAARQQPGKALRSF
jgi:putative ABC transport system permease protein